MNASFTRLIALFSFAAVAITATTAKADPLPGRDLPKFVQLPMIATPIPDANGTVTTYGGHDELSTAYGNTIQPGSPVAGYDGRFMADDFGDKLNSPVLHVKWWGSYLNDFIDPKMPVNKFLISFESDQAANTAIPGSFSHPDQPLLSQVVTRGPISTASGTFTEKAIRGPDPVVGESLYEYNAELNLGNDFPEKADTVYWLKITALVDLPVGFNSANPNFDPFNPGAPGSQPVTQWGWHNRDYTQKDTFASPNVAPGEQIVGQVGNAAQPTNVWHFQDDAVTGDVRINMLPPNTQQNPFIFQDPTSYSPTLYKDFADGPGAGVAGATHNIGMFSKDLAFELYTQVPEPATCVMFLIGCVGIALIRRR
jgi:hypothetical protein